MRCALSILNMIWPSHVSQATTTTTTCDMAANTLHLIGLVHNILVCDAMRPEVHIKMILDMCSRDINVFYSCVASIMCLYALPVASHHRQKYSEPGYIHVHTQVLRIHLTHTVWCMVCTCWERIEYMRNGDTNTQPHTSHHTIKISVVCFHNIVNELQHGQLILEVILCVYKYVCTHTYSIHTSVLSTAMMKYSEAYFLYTIL